MKEEKKEQISNQILHNALTKKLLFWGVFVLAALIVGNVLCKKMVFPKFFENKEGKVTTVSTSSLKEVFEMSRLSTLENYYNSYATVYDGDGKTVKYYVAYEGIIKLGIDFGKIEVAEDKKKKQFLIIVPAAEVQDVNVKLEDLEYIFADDSYETETVSQEAYKACVRDLEEKAKKADALIEKAEENAKDTVNALVEPFREQLEEGYEIKVQLQK
ncbi:MAG: DUF4230 domain-containing protein [Lachnospiraceae bacterium]|nr:DUF4230 domain-containing protein [Lachnospiraceae bacterium]